MMADLHDGTRRAPNTCSGKRSLKHAKLLLFRAKRGSRSQSLSKIATKAEMNLSRGEYHSEFYIMIYCT